MTTFTRSARIACIFLATALTAKAETSIDRIAAIMGNIEKQVAELKTACESLDSKEAALVAFCKPFRSTDPAPTKEGNPTIASAKPAETNPTISTPVTKEGNPPSTEKTKEPRALEKAPKLKPDFLRRMVLSIPATALKSADPEILGKLMVSLKNASENLSGKAKKRYNLAIKALEKAGASENSSTTETSVDNLTLKAFSLAVPAKDLSKSARKILENLKNIFSEGQEPEAVRHIEQALSDKK